MDARREFQMKKLVLSFAALCLFALSTPFVVRSAFAHAYNEASFVGFFLLIVALCLIAVLNLRAFFMTAAKVHRWLFLAVAVMGTIAALWLTEIVIETSVVSVGNFGLVAFYLLIAVSGTLSAFINLRANP